jgi:hypothetical protein
MILRVSSATSEQREAAAQWAKQQVERNPSPDYCLNLVDKDSDIDEPNWYCSEIVWAAYLSQGINIDCDNTVLAFFQLLLYVFLWLLCVFPCCVYIVSSAPKLPIPVLVLQITLLLIYHQTAFTLQKSHKA